MRGPADALMVGAAGQSELQACLVCGAASDKNGVTTAAGIYPAGGVARFSLAQLLSTSA